MNKKYIWEIIYHQHAEIERGPEEDEEMDPDRYFLKRYFFSDEQKMRRFHEALNTDAKKTMNKYKENIGGEIQINEYGKEFLSQTATLTTGRKTIVQSITVLRKRANFEYPLRRDNILQTTL